MLYTRKNNEEFNSLADQVVSYAQSSGYQDIKADFEGYDKPASIRMVSNDTALTPDFTAMRNGNKYYFELVIKNGNNGNNTELITKWKALEMIADMKGGSLQLFVPHGSYKFAHDLVQNNGINATLNKL